MTYSLRGCSFALRGVDVRAQGKEPAAASVPLARVCGAARQQTKKKCHCVGEDEGEGAGRRGPGKVVSPAAMWAPALKHTRPWPTTRLKCPLCQRLARSVADMQRPDNVLAVIHRVNNPVDVRPVAI